MNVIGNVEGKQSSLSMIWSTLLEPYKGADALRQKGAADIYAFVPTRDVR